MADAASTLVADISGMVHDPLRFVRYAFPWRRKGTPLANEAGPRAWQVDVLTELGAALRSGMSTGAAIQHAVASGHGIGKSALVAWIILWAMSTRENTRGVVTANTDTQLRTKTWPEVRKWHALAINKQWFTCAATSIHAASPASEKTWRVDAIPWSENNTEAFAGLHNKGSRVLVVFDEASAIADKIWEVTEGAMTDESTELIWCAFGNPTRNTGRFRECFGRLAHRWTHRQIDSRTVDGTNKAQLDKWVQDYGEDSDFVRVRVRGVFPRAGTNQLIPSDLVSAAADTRRKAIHNPTDPVVVGVDVARHGLDESTIYTRKGRDCRSVPAQHYRGLDNMQLAARIAAHVDWLEGVQAGVDAVFVDEGGNGGGVVDRLRQLGYRVVGVNFGAKADSAPGGIACRNKASEMWVKAKLWLGTLEDGGTLPHNDPELCTQLESREFSYSDTGEVVLEKKDDMRERGLSSPDRADGFVLTFAHNVGRTGTLRRDEPPERPRFDPLARVRR